MLNIGKKSFLGYGLRYSLSQLEGVLKKIKSGECRDIDDLSKYCDLVCFEIINEGDVDDFLSKQISSFYEDLKFGQVDISSLNTTAFGNACYIAKNHPDISIRKKAIAIVHRFFVELDCNRFLNLRA